MNCSVERIIVIIESPLNKRDYERFGIQTLLSEGFKVEVWDITPYMRGTAYKTLVINEPINCSGLRQFEKKRDIIQSLSTLDENCLVIFFYSYNIKTLFIYHTLSKKNIKYFVQQLCLYPLPVKSRGNNPPSLKQMLKKISLLLVRGDIYRNYFNAILLKYYKIFGIKSATIVALSGTKATDQFDYPIDNNTKLLWLHQLDYDIYLQQLQEEDRYPGKYAVFLDEYLPFHPDYNYLGIDHPISADEYYPKLCKFFDFLEKKFDLSVIIAAHPRSNYDTADDYFGGRTIIRGNTARLVKSSKFVIAHDSLSINFAVLYQKSIIFITTDEIAKRSPKTVFFAVAIDTCASEFRKKPVNIDNLSNINWEDEMKIDYAVYHDYKNSYIKKEGTPELPFWVFFSHYIKENF
ncbi:MAG: hypothetical protein WC593_12060 [Methanoregula sp.]